MERKVLLMYLKELRDLEFAKAKIDAMYNYEKRQFEYEEQKLAHVNLITPSTMEGGWTIGKIGIILFGTIPVLILLLNIDELKEMMAPGFFPVAIFFISVYAITFIAIPVFLAIKQTKDYKKYVNNVLMHNKREKECASANEKYMINKKTHWQNRSTYLLSERRKVTDLLNEYYSINILPNQFRNIQSVYYIYDYMSSSQETLRDTLLHEHITNEVKKILDRLDYIIEQNKTIVFQNRIAESNNQRLLEQNTQMLNSLKRNEENLELANQYAQISANYSKANAYFSLANYLK